MPTLSLLSHPSTSLRQHQYFGLSSSLLLSPTGLEASDRSCFPSVLGYLNGRISPNYSQRHSLKQSQRDVAIVVSCSNSEGQLSTGSGSISAARQRRLDKARTERERKEAEKKQQYPEWARSVMFVQLHHLLGLGRSACLSVLGNCQVLHGSVV